MQETKATKQSEIKRSWHLYDLSGKILGRAASDIAVLLRGKGKPYYVPNLDCGDYVVVVNARHFKVTGDKENKKLYTRYSGYPGGLKKEQLKKVVDTHPERVIRSAVFGMLPDNKLRDRFVTRLYIYPESDHPYKDRLTYGKK